jgi:transcriptional regulator with XRE-family HTH domain
LTNKICLPILKLMKPPIHPLRRWLFDRQETAAEFAKRVDVSEAYLSEIMRGKKRPSLDLIDKISSATSGEITALHFQQYPANGAAT